MLRAIHSATDEVVVLAMVFLHPLSRTLYLEKWISKMTGIAQISYGAAASKSICQAAGQFVPTRNRGPIWTNRTLWSLIADALHVRGDGGCACYDQLGLSECHRQAYLLSELQDGCLRRRLLSPQGTGQQLKLQRAIVGLVRKIWRWC